MQPGEPPDGIPNGFRTLDELAGHAALVRKSVPEPASYRPSDAQVFLPEDPAKPNVDFLRQHFLREGRVTEEQALSIIAKATDILRAEPNILELSSPVNICGDIHGQYYDLNRLFREGGDPANKAYLFLGDYVDRGYFSIECLLYLWSLKICYPTTMFLLRGNHECRHLTNYFTFKLECKHKYSERVYDACMTSFCALPLAAIVDEKFFCVHGGLSPQLSSLDVLRQLDRFHEPPKSGLICDLLWSDPHPNFGRAGMRECFMHNEVRGCSFYFTHHAVRRFLENNSLLCVIRAHEAQHEGYRLYPDTERGFPSLISVFSAPNYLDVHRNKAAILGLAAGRLNFLQFGATEHPFWLPNFADAFSWSVPFLASKFNEMMGVLLNLCSDEELRDEDLRERSGIIRKKILAVGRWARMYAVLREGAERACEFRTRLGSTNLPYGSLSVAVESTKAAITSFDDACKSDVENLRMPPPLTDTCHDDPMDIDRSPTVAPTPACPVLDGRARVNVRIGTTATSPSMRRRSVESTRKLMEEILKE